MNRCKKRAEMLMLFYCLIDADQNRNGGKGEGRAPGRMRLSTNSLEVWIDGALVSAYWAFQRYTRTVGVSLHLVVVTSATTSSSSSTSTSTSSRTVVSSRRDHQACNQVPYHSYCYYYHHPILSLYPSHSQSSA